VRLDIRRIGAIKRGDEVVGNETRVKVLKNKVAPPFKEVTFDIIYGEGISRNSEIIDLGAKFEIINKAGAWYSYKGDRIGQGKDNVRLYLKEHPEIAREIELQIREKFLPAALASASAASHADPEEEAIDPDADLGPELGGVDFNE
jgi:recombination protein RecA